MRFFVHEYEPLLNEARSALAAFVGAPTEDLVFVQNATTGVNAVLRSLQLHAGDELLTTDHAYNACRNALEFGATRAGARVVVVHVPFPIATPQDAIDPVLNAVTGQTRLALIDHVTSPTAVVLPVAQIVRALADRGVDTLVDGAHAPGMLPLGVADIGAAWYAGNCHKWMCSPKGAGFLVVRSKHQATTHPTVISHGARGRSHGSRFRLEFDWTGTHDPSPYLCVPEAIRWLGSQLSGGWPALMERNRCLAIYARDRICEAVGASHPAPDEMLGSMAAVALAIEPPAQDLAPDAVHPLQAALFDRFGIEVPIVVWNQSVLVRVSAQLYNNEKQIDALVNALRTLLGIG